MTNRPLIITGSKAAGLTASSQRPIIIYPSVETRMRKEGREEEKKRRQGLCSLKHKIGGKK